MIILVTINPTEAEIRTRIAECDLKIIECITERNRLAEEMGKLKRAQNLPIRVPEVEAIVKNRYVSNGTAQGISEDTLRKIAAILIDESVRIQTDTINSDR